MAEYRIRAATLADADALVRHRIGMFSDMGVEMDAAAVADAFRRWLDTAMPSDTYRAWVVETSGGAVVAAEGSPSFPGRRDRGTSADASRWSTTCTSIAATAAAASRG